MLEIVDIKKHYQLKDQVVEALKGVNICFRRSEFVSILGPSGCGKTTLLNIIGGLDKYTDGDLIIDGVSTKKFKEKDWDNYRNHRVGFVFQNYNLIPHQTVLENVELALTLSGIKKKDRRARAIEVLNQVGLGDKLKSRPNQLSGGQMQRVAIARALVNDPEIILADEPTGALDSKTSVQIMDLLKTVSKDRLVVMVTHNPELADQYSSRIIRLLDGELIEDSKPYTHKQAEKDIKKYHSQLDKQNQTFVKTEKKKSMSFFTALALSFKNLLTKKGRTIMVAFAGSIGIIGIALVLAVSAGMTGYINRMQSESLGSYPVTISSVSVNLDNVTANFSTDASNTSTNEDEVGVYDMLDTLKEFGEYNYLSKDFVDYVTNYYNQEDKKDNLMALNISYASDMHLITQIKQSSLNEELSNDLIYMPINNTVTFSALSGTTNATFFEELNNQEYVLSMYDITGEYPKNKNEVALVLNSSSVPNSTLRGFGIDLPQKDTEGKYYPLKYNDIINQKTYRLLLNDRYYGSNFKPVVDFDMLDQQSTINPAAMFSTEVQTGLSALYGETDSNMLDLKISCILTLKDDASGAVFNDGLMYTKDLSDFYRENCKQSQIVEEIKTKYIYNDTEFVNGEDAFYKNYVVRISELEMVSSMMGGNLDANSYNYTSPNAMKEKLQEYFEIILTPAQIIDLYLQVYGASDVPTGIFFYVSSFEAKDDVVAMINGWNAQDGVYKISYLDSSSMLTNMLGSIVDIISIILVAFASISLIVSSIMIGIITYTSVIERTKEIGVLRSVGASKKDVSRVFNAETTIIGLFAGLIGILVSLLITIPVSALLKSLTGVAGLMTMELGSSISLIVISVVLTFIAGLIPARIASKKDPVLALRSE